MAEKNLIISEGYPSFTMLFNSWSVTAFGKVFVISSRMMGMTSWLFQAALIWCVRYT